MFYSEVAPILLATLFPGVVLSSTPSNANRSQPVIEDVTPEDVKRFLDPTILIHSLGYSFTASYLVQGAELYTHKLEPMWAVSHWNAFWAEVPVEKLSFPDRDAPSTVGDVLVGWGAVMQEDLSRRVTSSVGWFEVLAPTGSMEKGTGFGTWVLAPGGGIALNPTDRFPIYITGRYLHSLGNLGGDKSDTNVADGHDLRVRSMELNLETIHIFPKGFYVAALPSFVFNLNQDFNFFSIGGGVGRALNRNFAVVGSYIHHVAGRQTFSQGFTVGLDFVWGEAKQKIESVGK